jgi:hypothetical protein
MYEADHKTYEEYGATAVAWGGKPTAKALEESRGLKFFGSIGMVTEFARYYERFPHAYTNGLCRDIDGNPVKVPWLTDHQHKGVPFWWCCTSQPLFRQYLRERVVETVKAGANGVHIDDHMGTAGGLWLGLCFCDRCLEGFCTYLQALPVSELEALHISRPAEFNYREVVRRWIQEDPGQRTPEQHPLWLQWTVFQCRAAASFMQELRELAEQTAGHTVPIGANAGLLWPRHLVDYRSLDLFSAETDHEAKRRCLSDLPLFAYRLADAVDRPYTATASGGDWAFIKENNLPGLVRGWIALCYASGQCFMVPNRQWCYTAEKGTHWYEGPTEKFAPLFQFVRQHASLFDGYQSFADVAVVLPHNAFARNPKPWFSIGEELSRQNISYRLLLAGDELVDHPLNAKELDASSVILLAEEKDLRPEDKKTLHEHTAHKLVFRIGTEVLAKVHPAVTVDGAIKIRILARVKPGSAVIHLVNYDYDPVHDDVAPLAKCRLQVNLKALGLAPGATCTLVEPEGKRRNLDCTGGTVEVPQLRLWAVLSLCANEQ